MTAKNIALFVSVLFYTVNTNDAFDSNLRGNNNEIIKTKKSEVSSRNLNNPTNTTSRSLDDLRYLSLGTTAPVVDNDGSRPMALSYASLLTSDPSNVVRFTSSASGGPEYPSVCTQSIVSDLIAPNESEEFDVIILEYYMKAEEGLYELARRLRERYPDARFVLLSYFLPNHINWFQDGVAVGNLQDWAEYHSLSFGSSQYLDAIQDPDLDLRWRGFDTRDDVLQRIARDFGAYRRGLRRFEPKEALFRYQHFFYDFQSLSTVAHERISMHIKLAIRLDIDSYPSQPRVGTWGDGDECHSWYLSGSLPLQYSDNLVVENFGRTNALSTGINNPHGGGWIEVQNPFDGPRSLFLSYMASGPPFTMYPMTEVTIVSPGPNGHSVTSKKTIDPRTDDFNSEIVNVIETIKVAEIPTGFSKVYWTPLKAAKRPFRLTATQVLSLDVEEGGTLGPEVDFSNKY